jgi:hypothetical protein
MTEPDVQPRPATLRDIVYFSTPRLWATWPFLPLVRRHTNGDCECGVLYDCWSVERRGGYRATVFLTNIFLLPRGEEAFLAMPKEVFDLPEEIADAGWRVDVRRFA